MKITEDLVKLKELEFQKRFNGYCKVARDRYLLLMNKDLNFKEFSLYTLLFDVIADWDTRHLKYGTFSLNYDLLSHLIKWSPNKIRRAFKSLINKGYIAFLGHDEYSIIGFKLKDHSYKKDSEFSFYNELKKILTLNS
jgi:hypothetical protein